MWKQVEGQGTVGPLARPQKPLEPREVVVVEWACISECGHTLPKLGLPQRSSPVEATSGVQVKQMKQQHFGTE